MQCSWGGKTRNVNPSATSKCSTLKTGCQQPLRHLIAAVVVVDLRTQPVAPQPTNEILLYASLTSSAESNKDAGKAALGARLFAMASHKRNPHKLHLPGSYPNFPYLDRPALGCSQMRTKAALEMNGVACSCNTLPHPHVAQWRLNKLCQQPTGCVKDCPRLCHHQL